ncbi:hypothetical protein POG22_17800 [Geitlerinema sp. CS-897]|nr:hypothetical protein [Geitlerinema sp. CS-897]
MNLTVLLIEPNGALERDLECPIAIEHCNVISTSDRWLGVYLARHHQPNVIVSTIDLPQLDRYEYERVDTPQPKGVGILLSAIRLALTGWHQPR